MEGQERTMNVKRFTWLIPAALLSVASLPAAAQGPVPLGTYQATLVNLDTVFPRNTVDRITIKLDRLTPPDEAARLKEQLRTKGQAALQAKLWDRQVGTVQVVGHLAQPIAAARDFEGDGFHRLILIVPRDIGFRELWRNSRSNDYPFTVVELDIDDQGRGSGEILPAARLSVRDDGKVQFDQFAFQSLRLLNVSPGK
jgi:hypothetical protein